MSHSLPRTWLGPALLLLLAAGPLAGCDKSSRAPSAEGTPAPSGLPPAGTPDPKSPTGAKAADPHAGMAMPGADPHAGMAMPGADPHAGIEGAPHGGDMEAAHGAGGMPATAIDPKQVLVGTIDVTPALKAQVKAGDILFLAVRSVGADGVVQRVPIAVDRVDVASLPMPFKLTQANVMMQGLKFEGNVQVTARLDRDGEATSREPGDLEGLVKVTIPNMAVKLVLDTPIR